MLLVILVLLVSLIDPSGGYAAQDDAKSPLVLLSATDRPAYRQGESATITLGIDNSSQSAVPILFTSGQRYDVVVLDGDAEVWRWSGDRMFTAAESEISYLPGLTLVDRITWDWRDTGGNPLAPGSYRVTGSLTGTPPVTGNVLLVELAAP